MPSGTRFVAFAIALAFLLPLVHADPIDVKISQYRLLNETAYKAQIDSQNQTFWVIKFGDNISLVFDAKLNLVEDQATLEKVLYDFYANSGQLGFTDATAADLQASWVQVNATLNPCIDRFYDLVETNFLIAQYRCIDPKTGETCQAAFGFRKNTSDSLIGLGSEIGRLAGLSTAGDASSIKDSLSKTSTLAATLEAEVASFDGYYSYFRGDSMASDPKCAYSTAPLHGLKGKAESAASAGITDIKGDTARLIAGYAVRKQLSQVKDFQVKGEVTVQEAQKYANAVEQVYGVNAMKGKLQDVQASFSALKAAKTFEEGKNASDALDKSYASMKAYKDGIVSILATYRQVYDILGNTSDALSKDKSKYGDKDERVTKLTSQYVALGQRLDNERSDLEIGNTANSTANLQKLLADATNVFTQAANMPSSENTVDPLTIAAVAVLVISVGGIVYYLKTKKPPKELSYSDLNRKPEEQNRGAMLPKP